MFSASWLTAHPGRGISIQVLDLLQLFLFFSLYLSPSSCLSWAMRLGGGGGGTPVVISVPTLISYKNLAIFRDNINPRSPGESGMFCDQGSPPRPLSCFSLSLPLFFLHLSFSASLPSSPSSRHFISFSSSSSPFTAAVSSSILMVPLYVCYFSFANFISTFGLSLVRLGLNLL